MGYSLLGHKEPGKTEATEHTHTYNSTLEVESLAQPMDDPCWICCFRDLESLGVYVYIC